ncbi:MAG TPA: glycerophosphodiester phosphodiesterase [Patescibacteria group bacterium]|nr:glycerophosphodiester phosphodiesterase [Patescibacteria group bacterium]
MKIIGHRGARGLAPENTLASFQKALEAGVDEIELDVRITKDGIPVLNHDPFLHSPSGDRLWSVFIFRQTLAELRKHKPDLTTLDEAVVFINRRVPIVVEVKPWVSTPPIIAALKLYLDRGWQPTDFLLASFSQHTLKQMHAGLPEIEPIVLEHISGWRAGYRARQVGAKRLGFNKHNLWWWFIRVVTQSGYRVTAHTLNDPHKAERWAKEGLYAIITDNPERFIRQNEITTTEPITKPTHKLRPGAHQPHKKRRHSK